MRLISGVSAASWKVVSVVLTDSFRDSPADPSKVVSIVLASARVFRVSSSWTGCFAVLLAILLSAPAFEGSSGTVSSSPTMAARLRKLNIGSRPAPPPGGVPETPRLALGRRQEC